MKTQTITALLLSLLLSPVLPAADEHPAPPAAKTTVTKAKRVGVEEFEKLRQDKANVVVDVRTEKEFKAGHIPGAVNLDVNAADFDAKAAKLDKGKTYLVHCAAGHRSATAGAKLTAAGFTNLYDLASGLNGWKAAGKPVEK